jgi:hypothetical protein
MILTNPFFRPDLGYAHITFSACFAGQEVINKDPAVWQKNYV